MPYLPVLHTPEEDRKFFRDRVFPACEVWVADAGVIAGFCAFRAGWVDHLYVDRGYHGRGLGSALLAEAMKAYSSLDLWTYQRNAQARAFYERKGFKLIELTDGSSNEEKEPDALYRWVTVSS